MLQESLEWVAFKTVNHFADTAIRLRLSLMKSYPEQLHIFFNALTFYTRLSAPKWVIYKPDYQAKCSKYLPWIGALIGVYAALIYWLCQFIFPESLAIILSMFTSIIMTGGIHEDGLADCCDGFGGGWDKQQILSIMKDSRVGTYAVLGLILVFLLKYAALLEIEETILTIIFAHCFSRFLPLLIMRKSAYAGRQEESKSSDLTFPLSNMDLLVAAIPALICIVLLPASFSTVILPCLLLTLWLNQYFQHRIGGYTGDCLGCCQQLNELLIYLWFCLAFL